MADRTQRLKWFQRGAEALFEGGTWLAAAGGPLAVFAVRGAAALTQLVIAQADARWQAVLDQPIGVLGEGYDVPGPRAVLRRFSTAPDWPGVEVAFADEVQARDWEALQAAHRILHEVLDLDRPVLRRLFAAEIERRDWRAVVQGYPTARDEVNRLLGDPELRSGLA
ncbi:MAG: hypothetical protein KC613_13925, partial [Myxococcales bacterium]|nr:hypothetical protein [Myxococcales bacterium]